MSLTCNQLILLCEIRRGITAFFSENATHHQDLEVLTQAGYIGAFGHVSQRNITAKGAAYIEKCLDLKCEVTYNFA